MLSLVALGYTRAEVAKKLWISENTVKYHLGWIYAQLAARGQAHAVALAIRGGMI